MARTDWVALTTASSSEYVAASDLERLCLRPYLPQACRRIRIEGVAKLRRFPLFPRYLLLPIADLDYRLLRNARGILKTSPVVSGRDGHLWRAPQEAVVKIRDAEQSGSFDEKLQKGARVQLQSKHFTDISALVEAVDHGMVELFTPLLGGSRLKTKASNVVIATVP